MRPTSPLIKHHGPGAFLVQGRAYIPCDLDVSPFDNIALLRKSGHSFIIKRNLRQEDPVKWLSHAIAQQEGDPERPREGKEVYTGTAEHLRPGGESSTQEPLTVVYRVVREEQEESWPQRIKAVARRRVGSVVRDLIQVASKWVSHSGKRVLKLAGSWPWSRVLLGIEARLRAI